MRSLYTIYDTKYNWVFTPRKPNRKKDVVKLAKDLSKKNKRPFIVVKIVAV